MDAITSTVLDLVHKELRTSDLDVDTPLTEAGLTSVRSVALLVALEQTFVAEFPSDLVVPAIFHSVRTMADAVRSVLTAEREVGHGQT